MRLLHVIASLSPETGGPPRIAVRLAAAQASLGADVSILAYADPASQAVVDAEIAGVPFADKVRFIDVPAPDKWERVFAKAARSQIHRSLPNQDFVYLHSIWDPISKAAADASQRARVPYAILLNGMLDPWSLAQSRWKKRLAMALGYRRMIDSAAFLHAGNDDEKRLIEPLGLRPPVEIIPNGVFWEEIEPLPPPGTFHAKHPELAGSPYVLFLSRLHFKKGLDYLADAFAIVAKVVPGARLVVAGPDDGERGAFESRVAAAGLNDRVHLVGPLNGREKFAAMVDAACFCLPSRQEGFSVAITEALACGKPVVISEGCHFPEVAAAGAGYVVSLDAPSVAGALEKLLTDGTLAAEMGRAARGLIASRYTWQKIGAQTLEACGRSTSAGNAAAGDRRNA